MENLPRKLKKKEASKTPEVMEWFLKYYPHDVAVEVKVGKNKIKDHQEAAFNKILQGNFAWKIADMGRRNPFDFVVFKYDVHPVLVTHIEKKRYVATDLMTKETFEFDI